MTVQSGGQPFPGQDQFRQREARECGSVLEVVGGHGLPLLVGVDVETADVARQGPGIDYHAEIPDDEQKTDQPIHGYRGIRQ